jgi:hypothetical protein
MKFLSAICTCWAVAVVSASDPVAATEFDRPVTEGRIDAGGPDAELSAGTSANGEAIEVELEPDGQRLPSSSHLIRERWGTQGTVLTGRDVTSDSAADRQGSKSAVDLAVLAGLKWLAAQQAPDGSWRFDAADGTPADDRRQIDPNSSAVHATALALLPFLAAGSTHVDGENKLTVKRGIDFLVGRMKVGTGGGDLRDAAGGMTAHGLATLVICESYAVTRDKKLLQPAQRAVDFIAHVQDQRLGGWSPRQDQAPSTLVTIEQILAMKSAHMAYLRVPPQAVKGAIDFLDRVQVDEGAAYRPTVKDGIPSDDQSTAAGLLCRMYLGWTMDRPALKGGVDQLCQRGLAKSDVAYNYWATQVAYHCQGEPWERWDQAMRDQLLPAQVSQGRQAGSWFNPSDVSAAHGGRLRQTALSILMLEVTYRNPLPVYPRKLDDDFPL